MTELSNIIALLRDPLRDEQQITYRMRRLDESFRVSTAEATELWHLARKGKLSVELETYTVALLSDTTQDLFLPYLYAAGFACGLDLKIYWPGADRIADLVLDPNSRLYELQPHVVFLNYDQEQKLGGVLYATLDSAARMKAADQVAEEIEILVAQIGAHLPCAKIVIHTFYWFHPPVLGYIEDAQPGGSRDVTHAVNARLREIARANPNVHLLDMERLIGRVGFKAWRNNNRWFGEAVGTVSGAASLAREYLRFIKSFTKRNRKVIVLDLDNTLWGGLAGEQGVADVKLGGGYPGNAYQQFQRVLKLYSERGVLLAINSKNNRDDAMAIIEHHPEMALRPDDFVAMEINWRDKATNMMSIAEQLDLGLNSFVFIDDSPQERELIRRALPEVLVPEFPDHVADLPYLLGELNDLDYESYTETDRQRTRMYRTESERRALKSSAASLDEYLRMLDTKMTVARATESDLGRVEQMFQRTNQFNTTTRRYTFRELADFAKSEQWRLVLGRVEDRFGDYGIVAAALLRLGDKAVIDSFLMSCRVIGRGVETAMLAVLTDIALKAGYGELYAEFVQTKKNEPSRDVYERHGFKSLGDTGSLEMFVLLELETSSVQVPAYIDLRRMDHD